LWLHLDGDRITEAHHCAICQPHDHVIGAACADCGDGPLITGQPPASATTPQARRWTGYARTAGKPTRICCVRPTPLITDPKLVCGW
jgi:hypothetical protein